MDIPFVSWLQLHHNFSICCDFFTPLIKNHNSLLLSYFGVCIGKVSADWCNLGNHNKPFMLSFDLKLLTGQSMVSIYCWFVYDPLVVWSKCIHSGLLCLGPFAQHACHSVLWKWWSFVFGFRVSSWLSFARVFKKIILFISPLYDIQH